MKFKKLGKIFDPTEHKLPLNCFEFAQSPQTLVFDDFIRVYFSTREQDSKGKFLSHIAFVDFTKDFSKIIQISDKPVINLGKLGTFDEHGIFPMNVLQKGNLVYGYTSGWSRRHSVSVETSIGLVVSKNRGLTFDRIGDGPILTSSLSDPFLVGDPFVKIIDDTYHMWYIKGTFWKQFKEDYQPDRIYKIAHATSNDGVEWTKTEIKQLIADKLGSDESQALPSVVQIENRFHMFFCFRESFDFRNSHGRGYRIGHAISDDLKTWTRDNHETFIETKEGDWDREMQCYPHVFELENQIFILYNGNHFGRYGFGLCKLEY